MGAGSWGTALAKTFADAGNAVTVWVRRPELAQAMNDVRENPRYLPGIALPAGLRATLRPEEALAGSDVVVCAVPSQTLAGNLREWGAAIPAHATVVVVAKDVESRTLRLMGEVVAQEAGVAEERVAVLTGPNLAREVALEQPAATVVACRDEARARAVQAAVATPYLRPYTNQDVVGCEIGGATKNVIALACGIVAGMGLGENTAATVITRGLAEITRLGDALGADARTFAGLAGLGDLVATCSSPLSRNRSFGAALGEGCSLEEAASATHGQVAEGVVSSLSILQLARRHRVEMPITQAVVGVCHEGVRAKDMIGTLMEREKKAE